MFITQLDKIAKDGYAGNLGEVFDFRSIGSVQVSEGEEENCQKSYSNSLVSHIYESGRLQSRWMVLLTVALDSAISLLLN